MTSTETPQRESDEELGPIQRHADELRLTALLGSELDKLPAPEYLIDGILPKGVVAALYGPPGIGKSFVGVDWTLSIASGSWWQGRCVTRGAVLNVAAEGSFGLAPRRQAWMNHVGISEVNGDTWLPRSVNLLDPDWAAALVEFAQDFCPVLIIIDTVARAMAGGDENSSKDMGALIAGADALCRATGATVLLVHHTPRNGDNLRGHTSLEGAVDTAIRVKPNESGGFTPICEKQKNAAKFDDIYLALIPTGESCVVGTPVTASHCQIGPNERKMLEALQAADLGEGLSSTRWTAISGVAERTAYRCQKTLVDAGLVGSDGKGKQKRYSITDKGKRESGYE
jgi:hypothetical protein